jgi:hypothetical protein
MVGDEPQGSWARAADFERCWREDFSTRAPPRTRNTISIQKRFQSTVAPSGESSRPVVASCLHIRSYPPAARVAGMPQRSVSSCEIVVSVILGRAAFLCRGATPCVCRNPRGGEVLRRFQQMVGAGRRVLCYVSCKAIYELESYRGSGAATSLELGHEHRRRCSE